MLIKCGVLSLEWWAYGDGSAVDRVGEQQLVGPEAIREMGQRSLVEHTPEESQLKS